MKFTNKVLMIAGLLLLTNCIQAQTSLVKNVSVSPDITQDPKTDIFTKLIDSEGGIEETDSKLFAVTENAYYLAFMHSFKEYMLFEKISKDFKLVKTYKYEMKPRNPGCNKCFRPVMTDNGIVIPIIESTAPSMNGSKPVEFNLFFLKLNMDLVPVGTPEKIFTYSVSSRNYSAFAEHCFFTTSPDNSKIVFFSYKLQESQKCTVRLLCFDRQLNKVWDKEVNLPESLMLTSRRQLSVDNNGDVLLLTKIYNNKAVEKAGIKPNYYYMLNTITDNGKTANELKIESKESFLYDPAALFDGNNIYCGGYYSEDGLGDTKGSYFLSASRKLELAKSISFTEFSFDFMTQYEKNNLKEKMQKKSENGKNVEMNGRVLSKNIHKFSNGNIVVSGEEYTYTNLGSDGINSYNGCIVAACYSPKGELVWIKKIPRKTIEGSFYQMFQDGDNLYYVFEEYLKNLKNIETEGIEYDLSGGTTGVVVKMGDDGEFVSDSKLFAKDHWRLEALNFKAPLGPKKYMIVTGQSGKLVKSLTTIEFN